MQTIPSTTFLPLPEGAARARAAMSRRRIMALSALAMASVLAPSAAIAQRSATSLRGSVTDSLGAPVVAASVHVVGTSRGASTSDQGVYVIDQLTPGAYGVIVRRAGFATDSFVVQLRAGDAAVHDVILRRARVQQLAAVVVSASPRLNETREQALTRQRSASNIVSVLSGDDIRALPNANVAEAIARMPGVSTERDEGEGKFVQIRGTEPRLSNVTINGAHVPGSESGSRVAKLDAIPTDIIGAIEVSKTLTADMDADAIGGSVNLVTKTPEGAPRGYLATQYGQASLLSRTQSQGSLMYGGRFGADGKLGALLGGTYDRNNRAINDLELAWNTGDDGRVTPGEWDQRDYLYDRTRYGVGGDLDYRSSDGSTAFLKGLWSKFNNFGTRYRYDVALGGDSSQAASGVTGIGTGAQFVRESQFRTPVEQMWGLTGGGKKLFGAHELSYSANYAGTRQSVTDYRTSSFEYDGPNGSGLALRYDGTSRNAPTYQYLSANDASLATNPVNFGLTKYTSTNGLATGRDVGGALDLLLRFPGSRGRESADSGSAFKLGVKFRDESKSYVNGNGTFVPTGDVMLSQVVGDFSDPSFYHSQRSGFAMGPVPNNDAVNAWENANRARFTDKSSAVKNALASYSGGERIAAAYLMNTSDFGALRVNVGVRLEHTAVSYDGNVATTPGDSTGKATGPAVVRSVPGTRSYSDLFPSVQLRFGATSATNVRLAVTRGIARANYSDLAPHVSGEVCSSCQRKFSNLSAGNPDLLPQHAWNVDLLGEHFIGSTGVLSGGVFYKAISDFIYRRQFVYNGPATEFTGYLGTRPENGGDGHLLGTEVNYTQRLSVLPGALSGLGVDLNWTHVDSRASLLADTATSAATIGHPVTRYAPLARQAKNIGNAALTYDAGPVSMRAAWQYQGASIYAYGDGSATPSGDNWFFPHSQIDAALTLSLRHDLAVQLQALNLNDAVFGFYNGVPGTEFSNQREYYGRSVILGVRYGFGGGAAAR